MKNLIRSLFLILFLVQWFIAPLIGCDYKSFSKIEKQENKSKFPNSTGIVEELEEEESKIEFDDFSFLDDSFRLSISYRNKSVGSLFHNQSKSVKACSNVSIIIWVQNFRI